ncbi:ABC transporter permease [Bailinhaonella thermotolerans]|uniref:ABC transporter permease n=1 Tax=Bailinhaonella thermotolerans TaxID=1070861 RepID=UPI00192A63EE|nr:ABC transporter permease [Bailinhaonella thermotolerans]
MNARTIRAGLRRGGVEYRQFLRSPKDVGVGLIGTVGIFLALAISQRGSDWPGTDTPKASIMAAGFVAFSVFSVAIMGLPMTIAADREEGALLRVRSLPGGTRAYTIGRVASALGQILTYVALMLAAALLFTETRLPETAGDWFTLVWVLVLGTLAVLPLGIALGSLMPGPRTAANLLSVPMMVLMIISGVMIPISVMPEPVQWVAQAFPLYWQGLGLRSALLPDTMLAAEIGQDWRTLETAAVLGAWAIAGMVLAPWLLRRVTRKESGSRLEARQRARAAQASY